MKRLFASIITLIILLVGCTSSAKPAENGTTNSSGITLDQALMEAASRIEDRIPAGSKIAALNFNSPYDKFSSYVLDELTANLVDSGTLTVVDRKEIDLIRSEYNFEYSGEVADDSIQAVGRMLGAQSIISGYLTDMGGFYRIVVRVLNVQNASVDVQYRANVVNDAVMTALLTGGKTPATAGAQATPASQTQAAQAIPAPPASTSYRVGDTGPAGGIIFYDKGSNSGGWRYLEAAPVEAEFQAVWTVRRTPVDGTQANIGSGRKNTQLIVETFRQTSGEWDTAAQKAVDLVFNGFNDWFLPSRAELDQMYGNLKRKNLGEFKNEWYWASSMSGDYSDRQDFSEGRLDNGNSTYKYYVRPIRQVPGV